MGKINKQKESYRQYKNGEEEQNILLLVLTSIKKGNSLIRSM